MISRLPPRRKAQKSGIERAPRRVWSKHERWVRGHDCCVPGCTNRDIVFAHLRSAAIAGTSLKSHSAFGISLCNEHHIEQHTGDKTFAAKYKIDPWALAAAFVRASPDYAMRESLKLVNAGELV